MRANEFPDYDEPVYDCRDRIVAVVGGGNTAMDAVRTALRLEARRALLLYRRTETEMPARVEEIHHAKEEGVEIVTLTVPIEFIGNESGVLKAARCQSWNWAYPMPRDVGLPLPFQARNTNCR